MPSQLTVTLPYGPGNLAVAQVITNVTGIFFRLRSAGADKMVLEVHQESPSRISEFDLDVAATGTLSISGQNFTFVVSS